MKLWLSRLLLSSFVLCDVISVCANDGIEPAAKRSNAMLLRVNEVAYVNGWRDIGEILVYNDGRYRHRTVLANADHKTSVFTGKLSLELQRKLQIDVVARRAFKTVDGVATYEYPLMSSMVDHPISIQELYASTSPVMDDPNWDAVRSWLVSKRNPSTGGIEAPTKIGKERN
jgi:hypothetical protein